MERRFNRRYKKLRVNKNKQKSKTDLNNVKFVDNSCAKDAESFKIDRFMKDVSQFCEQRASDRHDINACGDGFNVHNAKDKTYKRKEGLFQRGVIPQVFNKGLMPPSLSARLNEDLEKMIQLVNGKKHSKYTNKHSKVAEDNENSPPQIESSLNNTPVTRPINQTHRNVSPVQVKSVEEIKNGSSKSKSDIYLQFTHHVTRSVFNSGIDKEELRNYSDSLKESLIKIYHETSEECSHEDHSNENSKYSTPHAQSVEPARNGCPSTSRSEEGPTRKRISFANDSHLSDDAVIRKPETIMYASGVDFLKAVYGGNSRGDTHNISDRVVNFSPIQEDCFYNSTSTSRNNNLYNSTNSICNETNKMSYTQELSQYSTNDVEMETNDLNKFDGGFDQNPSTTLQYFPGINGAERRCNYNTNIVFSPGYNATSSGFSNAQNASNSLFLEQVSMSNRSPQYISLLPPNHRQVTQSNTNDSQTYTLYNGYGDKTIQSMLTIPAHPPPRKSPELKFLPRPMF